MNVKQTHDFFEENDIVALRAYKSPETPEVEEKLVEIGNSQRGIPYYAIYAPGLKKPITFDGIITSGGILKEIKKLMNSDQVATGKYDLNWQEYSHAKLGDLRAEKRIVFINFSGPNDATCVVNDAVALNVKKTHDFFGKNNIVALRAHKTRQTPEVEEKLVEIGNIYRGTPYYAIYAPGLEKPITFDGIITSDGILTELKKLMNSDQFATGKSVAEASAKELSLSN